MKKIDSFKVDHTRMLEGIYVSRKDTTPSGDVLTTIDIRMKWPNHTYIQPKAMHTIEHLGATFLRNDEELGAKVVYFGPMGCATGFYIILQGDWDSHQLVHPLQRLMASIRDYKGEVPGTTMKECGNYLYHDLNGARKEASEYLDCLNNIKAENLSYPTD